jgi:hypothetical protein
VIVGMHLLISVLITPTGLNKYRLGAIDASSELFRIERFLTAAASLRTIKWESVRIFYQLDEIWGRYYDEVDSFLQSIFPISTIEHQRLMLREQWFNSSNYYGDNDVILLQSNDDHALISENHEELIAMSQILKTSSTCRMGAVTHFPEMRSLVLGNKGLLVNNENEKFSYTEMTYAIGTQMVRGDFFKSWWKPGSFFDDELIVRPDNPFGNSVVFDPTLTVVPKVEIFRHMDGYSHIFLFRPLAPLKNRVTWDSAGLFRMSQLDWNYGLWPTAVSGFRKSKIDTYKVKGDGFVSELRALVGLLQSHWALRISMGASKKVLSSGEIRSDLLFYVAACISLFTFPVARNLPDSILDFIWNRSCKLLGNLGCTAIRKPSKVQYVGWLRGSILHLSKAVSNLRHKVK